MFLQTSFNEKCLKWMDSEKVSTIFKQLRKDAHAKKNITSFKAYYKYVSAKD